MHESRDWEPGVSRSKFEMFKTYQIRIVKLPTFQITISKDYFPSNDAQVRYA